MTDIDTSDQKRYEMVPAERQAYFAELAEKPGGIAYLGRNGVVRGSDGQFYYDREFD